MLQTLALAAAMSFGPAQDGLSLSNERFTVGGHLGPTRPSNKFLPGDIFFLAFDIEGLKPDERGKVTYLMGMSVVDANDKAVFENKPSESNILLPLGATRLPGRAYFFIPLDLKGAHRCRMTVTDKATGASKSFEKAFEVLPPAFGIAAFRATYDEEDNMPAPLLGVAGQAIWIHFVTVGFGRDASTKQPHNQVELRVYDANGKPTTQQGQAFVVARGLAEDAHGIDWKIPMPLNRPGVYTIEIKAEDKLTGKTDKFSFPLTVYQSVK